MSSKSFLETARPEHVYRPVAERLRDYDEVEAPLPLAELRQQSERCQNCGLPFCHGRGCPLGNEIPDFNAAVSQGAWRLAWDLLAQTSPFPEFTSRVCPALCEGSCTAGIHFGPVMVRQIEKAIVDMAFAQGWVTEPAPARRRQHRVAVVGAGPAGLAVARDLNRRGCNVTVYDRNASPGGLLRYGIPDFKLSKKSIERRCSLLAGAGIRFMLGTHVGADVAGAYLARRHDAIVLATGTPLARDLALPGRELPGVHLALDLLGGRNRANAGELPAPPISARGKNVLVIGGGDTGSDCVGTCRRDGAASVTQIEIMPMPPATRSASTPWPDWPYQMRTSSSHEEGCERRWSLNSVRFLGRDGRLAGVEVAPVQWEMSPTGRPLRFALAGPTEVITCDLVFLALGFLKQTRTQLLSHYGIEDAESVFLAGDAAQGPSLVVRALADGRDVAARVAAWLG